MKVIHKFSIDNILPDNAITKLTLHFPLYSKNCNVLYKINNDKTISIILHEEIELSKKEGHSIAMKQWVCEVTKTAYILKPTNFILVPTGLSFSVTPEYDKWLTNITNAYPNAPQLHIPSISDEYKLVKTIHITETNEFFHLYKHVYQFNKNDLRWQRR